MTTKQRPFMFVLFAVVAAVIVTGISGCASLQTYPVYSQQPVGVMSADPTVNLAGQSQNAGGTRVGIPPISLPHPAGRDGQIFHNALRDRLAPSGLATDFAFELINQSFSVSSQALRAQVGGDQTLSRYKVTFGYRVNRVDTLGRRTLAFADTLTTHADYNVGPSSSLYVEDARALTARRQAIQAMAQHVETSLQLQFARLNYDASR